MNNNHSKAWTTTDEIKAINYIASSKSRDGTSLKPTIEERKQKLESWIKTSYERVWERNIDIDECRKYVNSKVSKLS